MNKVINNQRYCHYKGGKYEVISEAVHTETDERLVIYRSIEDPSKVWARPQGMFFDTVAVDGETILRFTPMK